LKAAAQLKLLTGHCKIAVKYFATRLRRAAQKAVGELLRAINGYQGSLITKCALQLAPPVFVRPAERDVNGEFRLPALESEKMLGSH
jgi:hypothetical protein